MEGRTEGSYIAERYYQSIGEPFTHFKLNDSSVVHIEEIWRYSIDPKIKMKVKKGIGDWRYVYKHYEKFTARLTRDGDLIITDSVRRKTPLKE
jgi:hypothetical protein